MKRIQEDEWEKEKWQDFSATQLKRLRAKQGMKKGDDGKRVELWHSFREAIGIAIGYLGRIEKGENREELKREYPLIDQGAPIFGGPEEIKQKRGDWVDLERTFDLDRDPTELRFSPARVKRGLSELYYIFNGDDQEGAQWRAIVRKVANVMEVEMSFKNNLTYMSEAEQMNARAETPNKRMFQASDPTSIGR